MVLILDSEFQKRCLTLRNKVFDLDGQSLKLVSFSGTKQAEDSYTRADPSGLFRVRHFKSFSMHAQPQGKPISPRYNCILKRKARSHEKEWKTICLQMIGCSWRCWYCYVDVNLLSGNSKGGIFLTFQEMAKIVLDSVDDSHILDLTGGQSDLIPEWPLVLANEIGNSGSENSNFHIRSEDNLNNDFLWRFLTDRKISELANSPLYTRIGCFKGFNEESVLSSTKTAVAGSYSTQIEVAKRLFSSGFDPFYYVVFPVSHTQNLESDIRHFFQDLQTIVEWLPLRVVPLKLRLTTTWKTAALQEHHPNYEKLAHDIWFQLIEEYFGNDAFASELEEVLI